MRTISRHAVAGCGLAVLLVSSPCFAQIGLRDSIFRAQDAYQQGKVMGEGDASGLLGIVGNMIPDEGGAFSMPSAILGGAFGLLGAAQAIRQNAKEEMEQEQYFLSQYLGSQTQPGYFAAPSYYSTHQHGGPRYPQGGMQYAAPPPGAYQQIQPAPQPQYSPQPEVRRATAAPRPAPDPAIEKAARAAAEEKQRGRAKAEKAAELDKLQDSLSGVFAAEFESASAPAAKPRDSADAEKKPETNVHLDPLAPLP